MGYKQHLVHWDSVRIKWPNKAHRVIPGKGTISCFGSSEINQIQSCGYLFKNCSEEQVNGGGRVEGLHYTKPNVSTYYKWSLTPGRGWEVKGRVSLTLCSHKTRLERMKGMGSLRPYQEAHLELRCGAPCISVRHLFPHVTVAWLQGHLCLLAMSSLFYSQCLAPVLEENWCSIHIVAWVVMNT